MGQGTSEEGTRHDTTVPRAESGMQGSLSRGPLPVLSFDHACHISKGKGGIYSMCFFPSAAMFCKSFITCSTNGRLADDAAIVQPNC